MHPIPRKLDEKWYHEQLRKVPMLYKQKATEGYRKVWIEAYEAEPEEHKKENAASRAANLRLSEFVNQS